jgi:hypothetical protein
VCPAFVFFFFLFSEFFHAQLTKPPPPIFWLKLIIAREIRRI